MITEQELVSGLQETYNSLRKSLNSRAMRPSSLITTQTFEIDGQDMSPGRLDQLIGVILSTSTILQEDSPKRAFITSYQSKEDDHNSFLQIFASMSETKLEGMTQDQTKTILQKLSDFDEWKMYKSSEAPEKSVIYLFYLLGRRYRTFVDDTISLNRLNEELFSGTEQEIEDV